MPAIRARVQDAIDTRARLSGVGGSFGLWSPGSGDLWLDSYVTDFLTRARERALPRSRPGVALALDNLENALSYDADVAGPRHEIAYALYVLARNRRRPRSAIFAISATTSSSPSAR